MNSQIEDQAKSYKPCFVFEEHNEFIKREPSVDQELHAYPIINAVKTEQDEATQNRNNHSQFPVEGNFSVDIQAKVLQTFAPQTAKVTKHYTIATDEYDGSSVPDLIERKFPIETKALEVKIENFEPIIENVDINTIKNEENETSSSTLLARGNLRCNYCGFKTKNLPKLRKHTNECGHNIRIAIETINNEKAVKKGHIACDHCDYQTKTRSRLALHINARHMPSVSGRRKRRVRKLKYTCCFCDAKFTTKLKSNEHIREHSKKKMACNNHSARCIHRRLQMNMMKKNLLACNLCLHKCCTPSSLKNHFRYIHGKKMIEFNCDTCEVSFQKKTQIIQHLKAGICESTLTAVTANDMDVFDFDMYLAKTTGKKYLMHQMPVREPGYRCIECSFKCTQPISLREHTKQHHKKSAKKYYSCQFCKFKSLSKEDLKEHRLKDHKHEKPYFCKLCDCKYSLMNDLVKHIKSHFLSRR